MGKEKQQTEATNTSEKNSTVESPRTDHVLVPPHEVLSQEDADALLEKLSCELSDLPVILESDAALTGLGATPGSIIKISRSSPTAGSTVFYRRVVHE